MCKRHLSPIYTLDSNSLCFSLRVRVYPNTRLKISRKLILLFSLNTRPKIQILIISQPKIQDPKITIHYKKNCF